MRTDFSGLRVLRTLSSARAGQISKLLSSLDKTSEDEAYYKTLVALGQEVKHDFRLLDRVVDSSLAHGWQARQFEVEIEPVSGTIVSVTVSSLYYGLDDVGAPMILVLVDVSHGAEN